MTIGSRVRQIRDHFKKSRREFAQEVGATPDEINNIELDRLKRMELKEPIFINICSKYNVSMNWLKCGQGEMFEQLSKDEEIAKFVAKILNEEEESFKRRFIEMLVALSPDEWEILEQAIEIIKKRG